MAPPTSKQMPGIGHLAQRGPQDTGAKVLPNLLIPAECAGEGSFTNSRQAVEGNVCRWLLLTKQVAELL
uniref:Uncharacterized protein n=1 Tax=Thermogemmatispora argillosa TaxID=2045280 RepID=A0A455T5N3_9CHLR|nr:hypothetical protein KTA_10130 [Thermogemmatispora argillosa]